MMELGLLGNKPNINLVEAKERKIYLLSKVFDVFYSKGCLHAS